MYDYIPIILGCIILVMGIFMVACPKMCTKKELRDDPNAVAKVRKSGITEIVCGICIIGLGFWRLK